MELWADIAWKPSHQISTKGRVRNRRTGHILKPFADRYGYLRVSIGNYDNVYIHRLVCEAFHGAPPDSSYQVNHLDCDRQNNCVENLEWCTASENISWGVSHGNLNPMIGLERAREVNLRPIRIIELDRIFPSVKECAHFLGVAPTNVSRCLKGERKGQRLHGYKLEYLEED